MKYLGRAATPLTQRGSIAAVTHEAKKKRGKICFVIYIARERKLLFFIYEVIVKQKIKNGLLIATAVLNILPDIKIYPLVN